MGLILNKDPKEELTLIGLGSLDILSRTLDLQHKNKLPFKGVLTKVDVPSDKAPSGTYGHRVMIPKAVAEAALETIIGMGVNVSANLKDHAIKKKIGVITKAYIVGEDIVVEGHLFAQDFPEEVKQIQTLVRAGQLGMSFEISSVKIEDPDVDIWIIQGLVFTGAAILFKNAAAYQETDLAATKEKEDLMAVEDLVKSLQEMFDDQKKTKEKEAEDALKASIENLVKKIESIESSVAELKAEQKKEPEKKEPVKAGDQEAGTGFRSMMRDVMKSMLEGQNHDDEAQDMMLFYKMFKNMMEMEAKNSDQSKEKTEKKDVAAKTDGKKGEDKDESIDETIKKLTEFLNNVKAEKGDQKAGTTDDDKKDETREAVKKEIEASNKKEAPLRKTQVIDPAVFATKFGFEPSKTDGYSVTEIDELLSKTGLNTTQKIAAKTELQASGMLKIPKPS